MKKFYMTMAAMLCGVAAMAQTCTISAEDVAIVAGGEEVTLNVMLNESEPGTLVTGANFKVQFPEGIKFYYYDEDEEDYVFKVEYPNAKGAHVTKMTVVSVENNAFQISSAADGANYFKTKNTTLASLYITAPEDMKNGEYEIKIYDISFARPNTTDPTSVMAESCYPQEPFTVKLTVSGGTGINSINADDVNAPIYNIAGQRVSKAQKGVFIQNGKKVAVK